MLPLRKPLELIDSQCFEMEDQIKSKVKLCLL